MMTTILEPQLLTAEEYALLPDDGRLTELVGGRIFEINRPFTSHGYFLVRRRCCSDNSWNSMGWAESSAVMLVW